MAEPRTASDPILTSWKVSEVLNRYPNLLEVLIGLSPAFERLRNPILRRVQTRLVTVGQAARMAGLDPAEVVQALNTAAGLAVPVVASAAPAASAGAAPPWVATAPVAVDLDVRPFQERGEEPFGAIMSATGKVPVGQVLRLRNTFEPLPLYGVLGKRGFVSWARALGPDDWEILFFRTAQAGDQVGSARPAEAARPTEVQDGVARTVTIDVSDLVPPEPMVRILEALEAIGPGEAVLVHHQRRPIYLYPRLDELGYIHETRELGPGQVEILIRKPAAG